jgi:predicted nucleic acid-binding protein
MELILGARNKTEQQKTVSLLKSYHLVYPNEADAKWAMEQFENYYLSHQIEMIDCFIAATAVRLDIPIFTRDVKH